VHAQSVSSIDGTWVGVLSSSRDTAYTVVSIDEDKNGTRRVAWNRPIGGPDPFDGGASGRADADSLWLPLRESVGWFHLAGDRLRASPRRASAVELRRVRYLADSDAVAYGGAYRLTDGSGDIVVATFLGRVAFFDARDGRSARLNPDGPDAFTNGPGAIVHVPVEARWMFRGGEAGDVRALRILATNGAVTTATRDTSYRSEMVSYPSGGLSIAGTLRTPREGHPRPAILLISGSGPSTEVRQVIAAHRAWAQRLQAEGRLVSADKLTDDDGRSVPAAPTTPAVSATPTARLGGFYIIRARDYDEAVHIANDGPTVKYGGRVQVRMIDKV